MLRINVIWLRTVIRMFGFAGFVALFGLTTLLGCAGTVQAHDPAPTQVQDEPKKEEPKKEEPAKPDLPPEIAETFKTPLSAEGVVETKWTGTPLKVVVLRVPMDDNWNDDPTQCLGSEAARRQALAFESVLEQQIDYRPWLWRDDHPRVKRYSARLRFTGLQSLEGFTSKAASNALDGVTLNTGQVLWNKTAIQDWSHCCGSGLGVPKAINLSREAAGYNEGGFDTYPAITVPASTR